MNKDDITLIIEEKTIIKQNGKSDTLQYNCVIRKRQIARLNDVLQGKLFQKCTHLLYGSVLSLGGNVNTRRMSKPDMGSIFHIKN